MLAIKIPLKYINELRKILAEKEFLDKNYKILTKDSYGYIPIKGKIDSETKQSIEKELLNKFNLDSDETLTFDIVEKNLEALKKQAKSLTEHLKGKIKEEEIEDLKTSFDIIGDVVILEIPENLQEHKDTIGEAALKFTKRKAIFMKKSPIEGKIRTRQLEHIAGENNSQTIHKEHGIRLKLDVKKVYFSPRLATERKRVAEQVKDREVILDMFAGIGPFPIIIAKDKNTNIYAVDINEEAIKYMKENIKLNKIKGKITPILGDINDISKEDQRFYNSSKMDKEKLVNKEKLASESLKFDRIIMNLPGTGKDFLNLAISLLNNNG
ncbi:MAG: class I SAM-dependent methyltransferase family protein, partial [Methanobrevibacter sp.]|nr:class I SAM-dependent methyltransferase family protein [Methanobrevibacter sp.]